MKADEHKQRHIELHKCLDELVADWIEQTGGLPSRNTILQLIQWSAKQQINPTGAKYEAKKGN